MANPKKRRTKSAVGKNRAHLSLKKITLNKCPKCNQSVKPHMACNFCGQYRDRQLLNIKAAKTAKTNKK